MKCVSSSLAPDMCLIQCYYSTFEPCCLCVSSDAAPISALGQHRIPGLASSKTCQGPQVRLGHLCLSKLYRICVWAMECLPPPPIHTYVQKYRHIRNMEFKGIMEFKEWWWKLTQWQGYCILHLAVASCSSWPFPWQMAWLSSHTSGSSPHRNLGTGGPPCSTQQHNNTTSWLLFTNAKAFWLA